jgi:hypothetical protein
MIPGTTACPIKIYVIFSLGLLVTSIVSLYDVTFLHGKGLLSSPGLRIRIRSDPDVWYRFRF